MMPAKKSLHRVIIWNMHVHIPDQFVLKGHMPWHREVAAPKDEVALINSLKLLSQFVVYGDKHSDSFFEFFCEKSTLAVFNDICSSFVGDAVKEQVIQTINLLVKNVRTTTSFYYLLSNNYLNILMLKSNHLNFDNEEILAQYITLLKTISLKLNVQTIQVKSNMEK